jgi:hypothetical protein
MSHHIRVLEAAVLILRRPCRLNSPALDDLHAFLTLLQPQFIDR